MFCSFSGSIHKPKNAIHQKIDNLENLKNEVEKGLQQGWSRQEIRRKLLGEETDSVFSLQVESPNRIWSMLFLYQKGLNDTQGSLGKRKTFKELKNQFKMVNERC